MILLLARAAEFGIDLTHEVYLSVLLEPYPLLYIRGLEFGGTSTVYFLDTKYLENRPDQGSRVPHRIYPPQPPNPTWREAAWEGAVSGISQYIPDGDRLILLAHVNSRSDLTGRGFFGIRREIP